jgi:hypothetical protein
LFRNCFKGYAPETINILSYLKCFAPEQAELFQMDEGGVKGWRLWQQEPRMYDMRYINRYLKIQESDGHTHSSKNFSIILMRMPLLNRMSGQAASSSSKSTNINPSSVRQGTEVQRKESRVRSQPGQVHDQLINYISIN